MNKEIGKINNLKSLKDAAVFFICPHRDANQIDIVVGILPGDNMMAELNSYYLANQDDYWYWLDKEEFLESFTLLFTVDTEGDNMNTEDMVKFVQVEEMSTVADDEIQNIIDVSEEDLVNIQEHIKDILLDRQNQSKLWDNWAL